MNSPSDNQGGMYDNNNLPQGQVPIWGEKNLSVGPIFKLNAKTFEYFPSVRRRFQRIAFGRHCQ